MVLLPRRNLLDCLSENAQALLHVGLTDIQRRDEAQRVVDTGGQHQHVALHALGLHLGAVALAGDELDRAHQAQAAHVVHHVGKVGLERLQRRGHFGPARVHVGEDVLGRERLRHGDAGRARHRVARVRAAHGPGLLRVHQLLAAHDAGQGEPVGDPFRHDQDVRPHAVVLDGEHLARAPEAGLHLVRDEQDVVVVADLAHPLEIPLRRGHVAALAQHGLDEDGRRVAGRGLALQQQLQLRHGVHAAVLAAESAGLGVACDRAVRAVRERHGEDARHQGCVVLAVDGLGARHGHRAERAPVVAALHDDDVLLLGRVPRQLDRRLDGLGPGIPEEERVETRVRHQGEQVLDQFEVGPLECDVDLRVHHLGRLRLCRLRDRRVAVAQVRDPDAAREVQHLAPRRHRHVAARPGLDHLGRESSDAPRDVPRAEFGELGHGHCVDVIGCGFEIGL